ncbi:MAG TPA: hypothetical protein VGB74_15015 [Actinoplanes sp.]
MLTQAALQTWTTVLTRTTLESRNTRLIWATLLTQTILKTRNTLLARTSVLAGRLWEWPGRLPQAGLLSRSAVAGTTVEARLSGTGLAGGVSLSRIRLREAGLPARARLRQTGRRGG